jgi:hypothetical protein
MEAICYLLNDDHHIALWILEQHLNIGKNAVSCDKGTRFREKKDLHKICYSMITNQKKQEWTVSCQDFLAMERDGS